jgi:hypothetical protein
MKKKLLVLSAVLLISLISGCSKLGDPSPDTTPPTISSVTPSNNAINIALNTTISVTFSETMNTSSVEGAFRINNATPIGTFSWSGSTMTFSPDYPFDYNKKYTCTVGVGAEDSAGNALASPYTWSFTSLYSSDTTAPIVLSVIPSGSAENVDALPTMEVTFSEAMNTTSAENAFLINGATPTGTFSWNDNTMIFVRDSALSLNTTYTCAVDTGAKDLTGNAMSSAYQWSFKTSSADTTAPTVILVSPADAANVVAVSSTISATFSEGMNTSSAQNAFNMKDQSANTVSGSFNWSGNTMTFTPGSSLANGTIYTCTVSTGATDLALPGNHMAAEYSWSFKTALAAPTVVSVSPLENATGVPVTTTTILITFSEEMDTSSLTGSMIPNPGGISSWNAAQTTLTYTMAGLSPSTTYKISINARNVEGTYLAAPKEWSFTTAP